MADTEEQIQIWLNLRGKPIYIEENNWYNLLTSRKVGKLENRDYLLNPRICGTVEMMAQFMLINNLSIEDLKFAEQRLELQTNLVAYLASRKPRREAFRSIDDVPQDTLNELIPFSFKNLTVKAKVTRVVDGDTLHCAFILDPDDLSYPVVDIVDRKAMNGQICITCMHKTSNEPVKSIKSWLGIGKTQKASHTETSDMLIKMVVRLFGVDTGDADKKVKDAGTTFTENFCQQSEQRVWLQMMGRGVRGRMLARIFSRGPYERELNPKSKDLTSQLISYQHQSLGSIAMAYYGDNKQDAWDGKAKP